MSVKPYHHIPIQECHEPLVELLPEAIAFVTPHPYQTIGAPYGAQSPFWVRRGVRDRLLRAQHYLQTLQPGWQIQVFDAYRPIAVQQYMVDYTFAQLAQAQGLHPAQVEPAQKQALYEQVFEFWALPSSNPATPPPHSTGAALDVTLVDGNGQAIAMGSPIDEVSARSYPDHFAQATDPIGQAYHHHRTQLNQVMVEAGFMRHPSEWWHFSYGDQMWAWLMAQKYPATSYIACYGAVAPNP